MHNEKTTIFSSNTLFYDPIPNLFISFALNTPATCRGEGFLGSCFNEAELLYFDFPNGKSNPKRALWFPQLNE
ncbi:hypothetical protein J2T20_004247 [Paenibacillus wynnii]|nr:hypothetical protein [Paenibacillus wynnii]